MTTKKNILSGLVNKPAVPAPVALPGIQLSAKISGDHTRRLGLLKLQTRKNNNALIAEALELLFEVHGIE